MLTLIEDGAHNSITGPIIRSRLPARDAYLKYYYKEWWDSEFQVFGLSALKMNRGKSLTGLRLEPHDWVYVTERFGADAANWLTRIRERVRNESDSQVLWRYLYNRTVQAIEPEASRAQWWTTQLLWPGADVVVWLDYTATRDRDIDFRDAWRAVSRGDGDRVLGNPPPLDGVITNLFKAIRHLVTSLTRDAFYHQWLASKYLQLENEVVRRYIYDTYATTIVTRVTGLHCYIASSSLKSLRRFNTFVDAYPNKMAWLFRSPVIDYLWNNERPKFIPQLENILQHFQIVVNIFSNPPAPAPAPAPAQQQQFGLDQLGLLPSGQLKTPVKRLEVLAMREYSSLDGNDARKLVADEWMRILDYGDVLRAPTPASEAAAYNQALAEVDGVLEDLDAAMAGFAQAQYPDAADAGPGDQWKF
ncbi:unnamed protein product [Discula destructiva]